jgi:non-heme chloroperoxidase
VQGTHDQVMAPAAAGRRLAAALANVSLVEIADGPHAIGWTHASAVNEALLGFLGAARPV